MGRIIRRVPAFAAALLALSAAAAAQTRDFNQTVELASGGRLSLEGRKGDVTVTAWDEPRVEISARIVAPDDVSDEYARQAVEATAIDVRASAGSVSVSADYAAVPYRRSRWGDGEGSRSLPAVHYEVMAPREIDLWIEADRGDTRIEGFRGTIRLETDRGVLHARNLSGEVAISVDRGGDSSLTDIAGRLDLESDRTNLRIQGLALERDSRLAVDRGDLDIRMPQAQGLRLDAEMSRRAELDTDFSLLLESQDRRRIRGTINGGGPELAIEADRSTVRLGPLP